MIEAAWDLGTVPAWVGSVLTGGSLLLGFSILRRDRKQERSAQARKIICHLQQGRSVPPIGGEVMVHFRNTSDQPITEVIFIAQGRPLKDCIKDAGLILPSERKDDILAALTDPTLMDDVGRHTRYVGGLGKIFEVNPEDVGTETVRLGFPPFCYRYSLMFTDAAGATWIRDFEYERLKPYHSLTRTGRILAALGYKRLKRHTFYPE